MALKTEQEMELEMLQIDYKHALREINRLQGEVESLRGSVSIYKDENLDLREQVKKLQTQIDEMIRREV